MALGAQIGLHEAIAIVTRRQGLLIVIAYYIWHVPPYGKMEEVEALFRSDEKKNQWTEEDSYWNR